MENKRQPLFSAETLSKNELDSGTVFAPQFGADGLIAAIAVDADDGTVLMVAHMNADALSTSLQTGIATYWSRSRQALWKKGETSGNVQIIAEMRTDCDQDVILMRVRTQDTGANCHTGRKSCFYRTLTPNNDGSFGLTLDKADMPRFNPTEVYK